MTILWDSVVTAWGLFIVTTMLLNPKGWAESFYRTNQRARRRLKIPAEGSFPTFRTLTTGIGFAIFVLGVLLLAFHR